MGPMRCLRNFKTFIPKLRGLIASTGLAASGMCNYISEPFRVLQRWPSDRCRERLGKVQSVTRIDRGRLQRNPQICEGTMQGKDFWRHCTIMLLRAAQRHRRRLDLAMLPDGHPQMMLPAQPNLLHLEYIHFVFFARAHRRHC